MYWRCICMINKIKVLAADVDMTLSSKGSPLPEITIQALKELLEPLITEVTRFLGTGFYRNLSYQAIPAVPAVLFIFS